MRRTLTHVLVALATARRAYAQLSNVTCISTFLWMENDQKQNPCLVTANLMRPCVDQDAKAVVNPSDAYPVPGTNGLDVNACTCSSVVYMTLAACADCQGSGWPPWAVWTTNCPRNETSVGTYPGLLPIDVPAWAFASPFDDSEGTFNVSRALNSALSGAPNSKAATTPPSTNTNSSSASSTTATGPMPSSSVDSAPQKHNTVRRTVGIFFGAFLGLGVLVSAILGILEYRCGPGYGTANWRKRRPVLEASPYIAPLGSPLASPGLMKVYDPDDPTTFPPMLEPSVRTGILTNGSSPLPAQRNLSHLPQV